MAVKRLAPAVRQLLLETLRLAHRCVESLPVRDVFTVLHHVLSIQHLLWSRVTHHALDGWHACHLRVPLSRKMQDALRVLPYLD